MSFIKAQENYDKNCRGSLHWHRASVDGAPFRVSGRPPLLKNEEYEQSLERVYDAKVDTFDISIPEQKQKLENILDNAANQWFRILHMDRKFVETKGTWLVYVEWLETFMELPPDKQIR